MNATQIKKISMSEAMRKIHLTEGRIFQVKFVKRSTGELREMRCKTGDFSYAVPNSRTEVMQKKGLITVYDCDKQEIRMIPAEGMRWIKINNVEFEVY